MKTLVAWLGAADTDGIGKPEGSARGPIANAVEAHEYDCLLLLTNRIGDHAADYVAWLETWSPIETQIAQVELEDPTDHRGIYFAATGALDEYLAGVSPRPEFTFHTSPGTPAMGAIWLLLAKSRYEATLIQSSRQRGVREADIPFEIAAEFVPKVMAAADRELRESIVEIPNEGASFGDILYKSAAMAQVVKLAQKAATRNIPIIIEGETGTGKELFARAIHQSSHRSEGPFKAINCGAIPSDLVEAELFGTGKGAYTGAIARAGYFEEANGGTLFLDEIGDLPLEAQVKLLRTLQEGEITRVGETTSRAVDVRIVAASHRDLMTAVSEREFREDLLYRLLGIMLKLPPLRARKGDISFLAEALLQQVNTESVKVEPGFEKKKLSAGASKLMLKHSWPGNVRELLSTLRRAAIWADGTILTKEDLQSALLPDLTAGKSSDQILHRDLSEGLVLAEVLAQVEKHYLTRAMQETGNSKTKAAKLLGLPNYQTLSNRLKKFELD